MKLLCTVNFLDEEDKTSRTVAFDITDSDKDDMSITELYDLYKNPKDLYDASCVDTVIEAELESRHLLKDAFENFEYKLELK